MYICIYVYMCIYENIYIYVYLYISIISRTSRGLDSLQTFVSGLCIHCPLRTLMISQHIKYTPWIHKVFLVPTDAQACVFDVIETYKNIQKHSKTRATTMVLTNIHSCMHTSILKATRSTNNRLRKQLLLLCFWCH